MKRVLPCAVLAFVPLLAAGSPLAYRLDPGHTVVPASWDHFGFSRPVAHFGQVDGTVAYDPDDPARSSISATLPLAGLEAFVPAFNEHLRSADFFDAGRHPAITFRSTRVEAGGPGRLKVGGDLTIKGVTRPVVLDVVLNRAGPDRDRRPRIGFDASTTVRRSQFGLDRYVPNVSDEVTIRVSTEAVVPADGPDAAARGRDPRAQALMQGG